MLQAFEVSIPYIYTYIYINVYVGDIKSVISRTTDVLVPNDTRPSSGTMQIEILDIYYFQVCHICVVINDSLPFHFVLI